MLLLKISRSLPTISFIQQSTPRKFWWDCTTIGGAAKQIFYSQIERQTVRYAHTHTHTHKSIHTTDGVSTKSHTHTRTHAHACTDPAEASDVNINKINLVISAKVTMYLACTLCHVTGSPHELAN